MVLEKALAKATAQDGTISYSKLTSELNKGGTSAAKLTSELAKGGTMFVNSLNAANSALALSNRSAITLGKQMKEISRVVTQSFKFTAAQIFLRQISSGAEQAKRWVVDLNEAVNNIAVVTGKTGDEVKKVTEQAVKGSAQLKVAAKDYAEGALIFYQQGLNDKEVIRRNEITIKASKAAGQSIEQMSQQLTAIWNTYGMVGDQQEKAAAVGAALAANTAVDFKAIAEAMQVAAAPAAQMGVEYNQLAAIIATVGDTTQQSASTIGNAYKTIFSRFQQLRAEGTDGEITLSSVSSQLESLGIKVLDQTGDLRQLGDVINEVGNNWDNWSQTQQTAIAQIVGGTRQYGQFLALMENFDKYQKNLNIANNETGDTLTAQYEQALESIDSKMEQSAETWKRAFAQLFPEDGMKTFYDTLKMTGEVVEQILKGAGGLPGILSLVAVALSNRIVPTLINASKQAAIFVSTLTASGRVKNINRDYGEQQKALNSQIKNAASPDEKYSLQIQRQKLQVNKEIALVNEKINTALRTATGSEKISLEMQQNRLKYLQEQNQAAIDSSATLYKQYQLMGQMTSEAEKEAQAMQQTLEIEQQRLFAEQAVYNQKIAELKTTMSQNNNPNDAAQVKARAEAEKLYNDLLVKQIEVKSKLAGVDAALIVSSEKLANGKAITQMSNQLTELNKKLLLISTTNTSKTSKSFTALGRELEALKNKMIESAGGTDKLSVELQEQLGLFDKLNSKTPISQDVLRRLGAITQQVAQETGVLNDKQAQLAAETAINQEEFIRLAQSLGITKKQIDDLLAKSNQLGQISAATAISSFVQMGMAIGQCINGVRNLIDIWHDPDTSGLDKVIATFTQLSMMTYSVSMISRNAFTSFNGLVAMGTKLAGVFGIKLAPALGAAGAAGQAAGAGGAAAAKGLLAAGTAAGIAVAAIGAVVVAGVAIYNIWKKWNDAQPEQVLKRAQEAAKEAREDFNKLKSEVESLFSAFDDYKSAVDKLKECEEGSVEWYNALIQVNSVVDALIDKMPLLADYVSIDENGMKSISQEGFTAAREQANRRLIMGQAQVTGANVVEKQAGLNVIKSNEISLDSMMRSLMRSVNTIYKENGYDDNGNPYDKIELYVEKMEKWMADNPRGTAEEFIDVLAGEIASEAAKEFHEDDGGASRKQSIVGDLNNSSTNGKDENIIELYFQNQKETAIQIGKTNAEIELLNQSLLAQALQLKKINLPTNIKKSVQSLFDKAYEVAVKKWATEDKKVLIDAYTKAYGLKDGDYQTTKEGIKVGEEDLTYAQLQAAMALLEVSDKLPATIREIAEKRERVSQSDGMQDFAMTHDVKDLSYSRYQGLEGLTKEQRVNNLDASGLTREEAIAIADEIEEAFTLDWDGIIRELPDALKTVDTLSYAAAEKFTAMWQTAKDDFGTNANDWVRSIKDLVNAIPREDQTDALNLIANMDWSNIDAPELFATELEKLGLVIDEDSKIWKNFVEQMNDFGNAVPSIKELTSSFNTLKDLQEKGIKVGDIISEAEFNSLIALSDKLAQNFVKIGDSIIMIGDPLDLIQGGVDAFSSKSIESIRRYKDELEDIQKRINSLTQSVGGESEIQAARQTAVRDDKTKEAGFYYDRNVVDDQMEIISKLGLISELGDDIIAKLNDNQTRIAEGELLTREQAQRIADVVAKGLDAQEEQIKFLQGQLSEAELMLAVAAKSAKERKNLLRGDPDDSDENGITEKAIGSTAYAVGAQKAMMEEKWEDMDPKEVEEYSKYLQDLTENMSEAEREAAGLSDDLADNAEAAEDVALYTMKMNQGVEKLSKNIDKWSDMLNNSTEGSDEYEKAMKGIKDAMSDVLGVSEEFLRDDFIVKNMEDIKKAADGDAEAIDRLAAAAGKDIIMHLEFKDDATREKALALHDDLIGMLPDIRVGAVLTGKDDFTKTAAELLKTTSMTAEEANAYFRSIGFEPNFEMETVIKEEPGYKTVTVSDEPVWGWSSKPVEGEDGRVKGYVNQPYVKEQRTYSYQEPGEKIKQSFAVPKLSADGKPSANLSFTRTNKGAMNNFSKGNAGGGGGGKSGGGGSKKSNFKKKDAHKKSDPLEERYANIKSSIDKTSRSIEKLSDAMDDAWGAKKYKNLLAINQQLGVQAKKNQILLKEARQYLALDQSNLQKVLSDNGLGQALFNSDGFLSNKENIYAALNQLREPLEQAVQAAIDAYNAAGEGAAEEVLEGLEKQQEVAEKALSDFEGNVQSKVLEQIDKVNDSAEEAHKAMKELIDSIREVMSNWVEAETLKLDLRMEINDQDIRTAEHLLDVWGDIGTKMGMTADEYQKIANSNIDTIEGALKNAQTMQDMIEGLKRGDNDAANWLKDAHGEEAYNEWLKGNGGVPDVVMDQLAAAVDQMQDARDAGQEALRNMMQEWTKALSMMMDDFDKLAEKLEHNQETLDMWSNVLDGMGMSQTVDGATAMAKAARASYDTTLKQSHVLKEQALTAKKASTDANKALSDFKDAHGGAMFDFANLTENEQIQYQEFLSWVEESDATLAEAESAFKSKISELVDKMGEVLEKELTRLRAEFFSKIDGAFYDWDSMENIYGMMEDQEDLFLSDLDKHYNLDKLTGEINDYIEDSVDLSNMEDYEALLEEINGLLESGQKINQTDLDSLIAKFNIMKEMDAYEEAKNSKNAMRLQRDASGNYAYVYSSDASASDAEDQTQKLKDALYEYEKLQQDAADAMEDAWLSTFAKIGKLEEERAQAAAANDEKMLAYIDEQLRIENENLDYYASEIEKRYGNIEEFLKKYRDNDKTNFDWLQNHKEVSFNQSNLNYLMGTEDTFDKMTGFHEHFKEYMVTDFQVKIDEVRTELVDKTLADIETVGKGLDFMEGDYTDLAKLVEKKTDDIMTKNKEVADSATNLRNTSTAAIDAMTKNIVSNSNIMVRELNRVVQEINKAIQALQAYRRAQQEEMENTPNNTFTSNTDEVGNDKPVGLPSPIPPQQPSNPSNNGGGGTLSQGEIAAWAFSGGNSMSGWANAPNSRAYKGIQSKVSPEDFEKIKAYTNTADYKNNVGNFGWSRVLANLGMKRYSSWDQLIADFYKFDTGGYTGDWGSKDGKIAMLHEKELVLNAKDTENILAAVALMRQTVAAQFGSINGSLLGATSGISSAAQAFSTSSQVVDQNVKIEASFPGVSVAQEIEDALNSLITQAAQYNIKK